MSKKLDTIFIIGIVISISIGVIMIVYGQEKIQSLIVSLTITLISLLISFGAKIKESEQKIIKQFGDCNLSKIFSNDSNLLSIVLPIAQDYQHLMQANNNHFIQKANSELEECKQTIHNLREGRMITETDTKLSFGKKGLGVAKNTIRTVAFANPDWWKSTLAASYFASNIKAVSQGIKITRIWIHNKTVLLEYKDLISKQKEAGIETYLAIEDELPAELLNDYMIVDDHMLVRLELDSDKRARKEHTLIIPTEVKNAINNFEITLGHSKSFNEFFV